MDDTEYQLVPYEICEDCGSLFSGRHSLLQNMRVIERPQGSGRLRIVCADCVRKFIGKEKKSKKRGESMEKEEMMSALRGADQKLLRRWLGSGDGHTIYEEDYFKEMKLPGSLIGLVSEEHVSDKSNWKETITDNKTGRVVDSMNGVYGLDLVRTIATSLGLESRMRGRGFMANDLGSQILEVLSSDDNA